MIQVGDTVRVTHPGIFAGQLARVERIDATSKAGKVWYRLATTINGRASPGWFEAGDIEELPKPGKLEQEGKS